MQEKGQGDELMDSPKFALSLDIGGTFLKSALIDSNGLMLKRSFQQIPVDSQGSGETIISTFVRIIKSGLQTANKLNITVTGMGISTPGPFDYKKNTSLMKHKFGSIYGIDLKQEFIKRLELGKDFPIQFIHDAHAFLIGETWHGAAKDCNRAVGITLGTGIGAAFMINNRITDNGNGGPLYSVWQIPYQDGIAEDRISSRGIIARYKELAGKNYQKDFDVKDIANQALKSKDNVSLQVFEELGSILGEVLTPILSSKFKAECLVLGGQISKSFILFSKSLKRQLLPISGLKKVSCARRIDLNALYGAVRNNE